MNTLRKAAANAADYIRRNGFGHDQEERIIEIEEALLAAPDDSLEAAIDKTQRDIASAGMFPAVAQMSAVLPLQRHLRDLLEQRAKRLSAPQPPSGGEVVAWHIQHEDGLVALRKRDSVDSHMREQAAADGVRIRPLVYGDTAPPSAPVGVPADVVREYLDARACYEAAIRPPNSHAPAPVLRHDNPDALRLRSARIALDSALAQQPPAEAQAQGGGGAWKHIRPHANEWRRVCEQAQRSEFVQLTGSLVEGLQAFVEEAMAAPPSAPVGVERVARAMAENDSWHGWDTAIGCGDTLSGNTPNEERDHYRDLARVAIAAMSAPPSAPVGVKAVVEILDRLIREVPMGLGYMQNCLAAKAILAQQPAAVDGARPLDEWHEDDGPVVWWKPPVDEPAWIGTPLDSDWPGYHTHWTPHPAVPALAAQPGGSDNGR